MDWHGLQASGRFLKAGDIVPKGLISDHTLAILLRMNQVAKVEPAETEILSDDPPAPITDSDEETDDAAELVSDAQSEQPAIRRGRGRPRKSAAA